ncbi:tripartite tricarboxylate transporter permease [Pelagibacterium luteolum]|uniref:Putative tricarboxylic transport membrane protein n=1 Tax=Pelagibacterium luteolum TaxID=440168 RepID=A0A1G7ZRK3_9HYPH|nr:tripartite tricarboxylate transporter permease [Pelagibacterium luteolum]SDH11321.1 putative tricarboxylic transport membrane protein [Pelagibacterium luteolum]
MVSTFGLLDGFAALLDISVLAYCLLGVTLGTLIGVLPGLGPLAGMALLLPLTYTLSSAQALIMLCGIFYGTQYGNSISAILLNIPGDPGAAATTLDGNKLAKSGRAGTALAIAAIASFVGGTVGTLGLMLFSETIVPFALQFGPTETLALLILGLVLVSALGTGSIVKALCMATFGLLLTIPGSDPVSGASRMTFGFPELYSGLGLVPVAMGLFAISEVLINAQQKMSGVIVTKIGRLLPTFNELLSCIPSMLRGTPLGFLIGVLPGAGSAPAAFAAYGLEKRFSRNKQAIGEGSLSGVAAPESANNAAAAGSLVPLLSLGIPGSPPAAIILGALIIQGIQPGPLFVAQQPELFWTLIASLYLANVLLVVLNLPLVGIWARILMIPFPFLAAAILVVSVAGVYSTNNSFFDVWVMLALGVAGWLLRSGGFPLAPILLGLVLGGRMEESFRQALVVSNGNWDIFVSKPITVALFAITLSVVGWSLLSSLRNRRRSLASIS